MDYSSFAALLRDTGSHRLLICELIIIKIGILEINQQTNLIIEHWIMYQSHAPSSRRTDRALSTASRDGASTKSKSEGSEIPSIISFSIACPRWIRRISGTDCGRIRSNWSRE